MPHFSLNGVKYETTDEGYLLDLNQWNDDVARYLAKSEGIGELSGPHWEIILFLRWFYKEYAISPMVKILMKELEKKYGKEKSSRTYLYELFPHGPSKQGTRIAGLPKPHDCID